MKNQKENSKNVQRSILFSPPDISDLEIAEVVEALKSGWITTGPRTKELEKRLAGFCHTSKVVCLNSATAAEELNFRICGIGEGDEVIVPAYTYTATASAAIHCGAKVIFVDPNHPERVSSPEAKGLRHMAFTVDKIEDLDMEMEKIRTDWFGRRFTFVKDLDGLPIEIKECGSTLK